MEKIILQLFRLRLQLEQLSSDQWTAANINEQGHSPTYRQAEYYWG